jgi:hypothetical protein
MLRYSERTCPPPEGARVAYALSSLRAGAGSTMSAMTTRAPSSRKRRP